VFNGLPEDVQAVLADLGMEYSVENARIIEELEPRVFSLFEAEGATVLDMPPGLREEYVNGLGDLAGRLGARSRIPRRACAGRAAGLHEHAARRGRRAAPRLGGLDV
jgi:hypothetical protein